MANDVRPLDDPAIDPGDSAVVWCEAPYVGGLDTLPTGEPRVYCHVNVEYIGPAPAKPDLSGPALAGTYGSYVGEDGGWTILLCEPARAITGGVASGRYAIDLNDSLFTRGYMIEYYFKAYALGGASSTDPPDAEQPAGKRYEFTCLPTLESTVLYVDDFDGRGTHEGTVENYFNSSFASVLAERPDRYDVGDRDVDPRAGRPDLAAVTVQNRERQNQCIKKI